MLKSNFFLIKVYPHEYGEVNLCVHLNEESLTAVTSDMQIIFDKIS